MPLSGNGDHNAPGISADAAMHRAVLWKVTLRLIPFLFLLYMVNILDRINVGFARLRMLDDLHMSEQVYGLGAGIFFIGYFIFEVPSNLIMRRIGARRWIGRILISWGLVSCAMMYVTLPWHFYLLRILLGVAEAGFFPGIILYLTYWFPSLERSRAVSRFMTASPLVGVLGNPLSGALLQYTDGIAGLHGWQWLFLVEGLPAVLLGVISLFYLTDRPEVAHWLSPPEREWLSRRMSGEERYRQARHGLTLGQAMANPAVWLLCALYFTVSTGANTFGLYLPKLIQHNFSEHTEFQVGILAAVPSIAGAISMVLVGTHSDRTGERRWHVALPAFVAAAGWTMTAVFASRWLVLIGLCLAQMGMMSMLAPFWSLPTSFLSGAAAAGGIAMINSVGNLGGFFGPNAVAQWEKVTGTFTYGLLTLAATMFIGGFLALCAHHDRSLERAAVTADSDRSPEPATT